MKFLTSVQTGLLLLSSAILRMNQQTDESSSSMSLSVTLTFECINLVFMKKDTEHTGFRKRGVTKIKTNGQEEQEGGAQRKSQWESVNSISGQLEKNSIILG